MFVYFIRELQYAKAEILSFKFSTVTMTLEEFGYEKSQLCKYCEWCLKFVSF